MSKKMVSLSKWHYLCKKEIIVLKDFVEYDMLVDSDSIKTQRFFLSENCVLCACGDIYTYNRMLIITGRKSVICVTTKRIITFAYVNTLRIVIKLHFEIPFKEN